MTVGGYITQYTNYAGRTLEPSLTDKIFKDKKGRVVIYQRPNVWLIGWAVLDIVAIFAPGKNISNTAWTAGAVVLIIWSLLEILRGVNYFRRVLGLAVLLVIVATFFKVGL
jgi:hypothetical protein